MDGHLHIGEIIVPGPARSSGTRSFVLNRTAGAPHNGGTELFFGLFSAEAPRKIVDKFVDRLVESASPSFFDGEGDVEARYEEALKQANKSVLSFLHDHGLSLPGIKLRGVIGCISGNTLMISNRGGFRGIIMVPKDGKMAGLRLFQEGADTSTDPKFFSSFQAGMLPPGSALIVATRELLQAADEPHLRELFGRYGAPEASRRLKRQLRGCAHASALTIGAPRAEGAAAAASSTPAPSAAPERKPRPARKREREAGLDIGEIGARTIEGFFVFIWQQLKRIPRGLIALARGLAVIARLLWRAPRLAKNVNWRALPHSTASKSIEGFNALPRRSKAHLLLLLAVSAVFVHGLIFTFHRHSIALEARAYEAKLAEIEQLRTDLETSLIIGNDRRSHDLLGRMTAAVSVLPEETEQETRTKEGFASFLEEKRDVLRHVVEISRPEVLASIDDPAVAGGHLVWFDRSLYAFSRMTPAVAAIALDGSVTENGIENAPGGVASAAPARTGILLRFDDGEVGFWDPQGGSLEIYPEPRLDGTPIMYYQSRLYSARADGMVVRRPIVTDGLGAPTEVLHEPSDLPEISGLAADGAAYLLSPAGELRKYLKGQPVAEFTPPIIDPPPARAEKLWADIGSSWLVFIDRGGGRVFVVNSSNGKLAAQITSPAFSGIASATVDPSGEYIYVLAGGKVLSVPLQPAVR